MLGKVTWWDKEGGVGTIEDVDGREWHASDDMIDADELKSKMGSGAIVNFEPNPSLDNSAMRIDISSPDDSEKFNTDHGAAMSAKKQAAEAAAAKANLSEAEPTEPKIDWKAIEKEAPHDLQEYVSDIIDYQPSGGIASVRETLEDDDAMAEMADSGVEVYYNKIWAWYAEDLNRVNYADEAIESGTADPKKGVWSILQAGHYDYNAEYLEKARTWLREYLDEHFPTNEGAEIGSLAPTFDLMTQEK